MAPDLGSPSGPESERKPMTAPVERPDVGQIYSRLKDFQRRTADYAFRRLYTDQDPVRRFLVADEVGLGKTLVARGVIARALDHLWDKVERLDVIYICSNIEIARQNVSRLNVLKGLSEPRATRLTMLPLELRGLQDNRVNFVSFTPGTSFEFKSNTGLKRERVLLYWMLRKAWNFGNERPPMNVMQAYAGADHFRKALKEFDPEKIDPEVQKAFAAALREDGRRSAELGEPTLHVRFNRLQHIFARADSQTSDADNRTRSRFIADLRGILARTCVKMLQPDLIVLDEFQRFKNLLGGDDDAAILARALFDYRDANSKARVLLLSATPYKMYTTADESDVDNHYADFLETVRFLQNDAEATERLEDVLDRYRRLLFRLGPETRGQMLEIKSELESALARVMTRTERLAATEDRSGMLVECKSGVSAPDLHAIRNYNSLQRLARAVGHPDTVEYWKSAPYLLNFMMEYKFKEELKKRFEHGDADVASAVKTNRGLLLQHNGSVGAGRLDPSHARVRWLLEDTIERGLWRILWLPPSLPYYQLGEPFAGLALEGVTKRLIFSAWKVVPKAIAAILSYEAERRMLAGAVEPGASLDTTRRSMADALRFARSAGRLSGMPVLGLLYPSFVLASLADPLDPYYRSADGQLLAQSVLLASIEDRLEPLLREVTRGSARATGPADESWYWAAPLLLDLAADPECTREWLHRPGAATKWIGGTTEDEGDDPGVWGAHVAQAAEMLESAETLGRPPEDLGAVLALLALAGPGVVALRSISRITGGEPAQMLDSVRDAAGSVAWGLRNLFNLPDSTALLRSLHPNVPYWRAVLEYSAAGGIQAVLDEYQHILPEFVGLAGRDPETVAAGVAEEFRAALALRTAAVAIDDFSFRGGGKVERTRKLMRSRFAARFGDADPDPDAKGDLTRSGQLRSSFNSPFWPFVLATTSVGQEGLDFHQYCHAVVHWNLPSNPVDLEQREGRVHRYKGHAVRKNVARRYRATLFSDIDGGEDDPWRALFEMAKRDRPADATDIIPYWVFSIDGGAAIERHVPTLPLSREVEQLAALRRTLAVYRMVFGQPRQDELLDYLLGQMDADEAAKYLQDLRISLDPA